MLVAGGRACFAGRASWWAWAMISQHRWLVTRPLLFLSSHVEMVPRQAWRCSFTYGGHKEAVQAQLPIGPTRPPSKPAVKQRRL